MKSIRTIATLAVSAAALAATATSASAGVPTGDFAPFKYCPYTNASVTQCLYSDTSSGAIKLGNSNVPINKHLILQGGINQNGTTITDAVGAPTLSKTPLDVPGGLISMVSDNWFFGPLLDAFNWAISFANGVTATAEPVGPIGFNLGNVISGQGTGVQLPVRVHLENPFLGDNCYIGSAASPVTFKLTTGTTSPPSGTAPITGNPGTFSFNPDFTVTTLTGLSLVDNTFTAPKAEGCGNTFIDRPLVTAAVNLKIGLNAPAGASKAVLNGTSKIAASGDVATSAGS